MNSWNTKKWLLACALVTVANTAFDASAFIIDPVRCTWDSVGQGAPAEGRNAWFKACKPELYDAFFSEGEFMVNKTKFDRRLYVTFGVPKGDGSFDFPGNWMAPTDPAAPCSAIPAGYKAIGVCTSGCYLPGTLISTPFGMIEIEEAKANKIQEVMTLTPDSARDQMKFQAGAVRYFLADLRDAEQELLEIHTQSGGSITVTQEHPLLDSDGKMRRADNLKIGEALVRENGTTDVIVDILGRSFFGKVYNVSLKSRDDLENIVIANGYVNGSLYYQNEEGVSKLNRRIFREHILPVELISE